MYITNLRGEKIKMTPSGYAFYIYNRIYKQMEKRGIDSNIVETTNPSNGTYIRDGDEDDESIKDKLKDYIMNYVVNSYADTYTRVYCENYAQTVIHEFSNNRAIIHRLLSIYTVGIRTGLPETAVRQHIANIIATILLGADILADIKNNETYKNDVRKFAPLKNNEWTTDDTVIMITNLFDYYLDMAFIDAYKKYKNGELKEKKIHFYLDGDMEIPWKTINGECSMKANKALRCVYKIFDTSITTDIDGNGIIRIIQSENMADDIMLYENVATLFRLFLEPFICNVVLTSVIYPDNANFIKFCIKASGDADFINDQMPTPAELTYAANYAVAEIARRYHLKRRILYAIKALYDSNSTISDMKILRKEYGL